MAYIPSKKILDKYADVLVNFALNNGKGVRKEEVVFLQVPECAKPLLNLLVTAVLKAGAHPIIQYLPENVDENFFKNASEKQIRFFPESYLKGRVDAVNHFLAIISSVNKKELQNIDPKKIMAKQESILPYWKWREEKQNKGKLSRTVGLYGTKEMAKEISLGLKEYWNQIIKACYLNEKNPVKKWKQVISDINKIISKLNKLKIEKLHIEAKDVDLWIGIGNNRKWLGGNGQNIPSFEIFISPDFRKTQGKVKFTEPLYAYGNLIKGIELEFKNGKVVKASAKKGEKVLKEMIKVKGANQIGEFSLTDIRFSKIDKFMGETLYDENVGKKFGNFHIALGEAYKNSYTGSPSKVPNSRWKKMGFNESVIHTDIVSTENRKVIAFFKNGSRRVIYTNGKFVI